MSGKECQPLLPVQPGEFPVTERNINRTFKGAYQGFDVEIGGLLSNLYEYDNGLFEVRRQGVNKVIAITDPLFIFEGMNALGCEIIDPSVQEVLPTDFQCTQKGITQSVKKAYKRSWPVVKGILNELQQEDPELIKERRQGSRYITVVTDRRICLERLEQSGLPLRPEAQKELSRLQNPRLILFDSLREIIQQNPLYSTAVLKTIQWMADRIATTGTPLCAQQEMSALIYSFWIANPNQEAMSDIGKKLCLAQRDIHQFVSLAQEVDGIDELFQIVIDTPDDGEHLKSQVEKTLSYLDWLEGEIAAPIGQNVELEGFRQLQIERRLKKGKSKREIAKELGISGTSVNRLILAAEQ